MPLTLRRIPATARYYTESLDALGEAIPLQMLLIPGGPFLMGSPEDEPNREDDEIQHQVTVPDFFMGRYPVTQAQWRAVAALPKVKRWLAPAPSYVKGENRPVESVYWYDAVEFCDRLQQHTGRPYRLPSEAEWEYACRAGTTTPFHFGKTLSAEVANYHNKTVSPYGSREGGSETTTNSANVFGIANRFGLCDMHGNVQEWCADHYSSYEQTPTDGSVFVTEDEETDRIFRGGSWGTELWDCRSAKRYSDMSNETNNGVGFRVSCSAPRS